MIIINYTINDLTPFEFRDFYLKIFDETVGKNRYDEFKKKLNINENVDNKTISKVTQMIRNDTDTCFFTTGIFFYKWEFLQAKRLYDDNVYSFLYVKDNDFLKSIINGDIKSIKVINDMMYTKFPNMSPYKIYVFGLKDTDGTLLKEKKIGSTSCTKERLKLTTGNNHKYPFVESLWCIHGNKELLKKTETRIHSILKKDRLKGKKEWYTDNGNICDMIENEIKKETNLMYKKVI